MDEVRVCACGCGTPTERFTYTNRGSGAVRGEWKRFAHGHNGRGKPRDLHGPKSPSWRGGTRYINPQGYVVVWTPDGQRLEHRVVAERVLGRPLSADAQVHHVNGNRTDNRPANLVICQNPAYHSLLERRQRALDECGNANWLRCPYCKEYDSPDRMYIRPGGLGHHLACSRSYKRRRRERLACV